ncbi:hypothetical protein [Cobetia sp. 5-25-4-2]|nr:hypothetical protein [Cobetia sp. 5-25-4-2]
MIVGPDIPRRQYRLARQLIGAAALKDLSQHYIGNPRLSELEDELRRRA